MQTPALDLRPMGFGEILDGAFSLYRRNFRTFFLTALIPIAPLMVLLGFAEHGFGTENLTLAVVYILLLIPAGLLAMLGSFWIWTALTLQAAGALGGRRITVTEGFRRTFRPLFSVIGAGILAMIALSALGMSLMFMGAMIAGAASLVSPALAVVLTVALVIGGLLAMSLALAMLFGVVPAVVLEGQGPFTALQRSVQLSRGGLLRILGVLVVCWLIIMLPSIGVTVGIGMGPWLWSPEAATEVSILQIVLQQVLGMVTSALTTPFFATAVTLLYFDRRVRTEAYDLELAAEELVLTS